MRNGTRLTTRKGDERGFVLLAVLAFIAFILPVILLVLSTISTETMSVGETVKGAKADRAAEQAIGNATQLLIQDRQYPDYWNSLGIQMNAGNTSIIVDDGYGYRRNELEDGQGAGPDGVYGTDDDYWIGPRKDRSFLPTDDTDDPRNYRYDFRFLNTDGPVYLAQRWAYNLFRNPYFYEPVNASGIPIQFYNQFAAVEGDTDGDGMNEGFAPSDLDQLLFPGYYPAAMPAIGPYNSDITDGAAIAADMLDYRTQLYGGIYENLEQGPVPSTLTRSYGSVTDENGRLNLNIFCKKVRVWAPESSSYDTSYWSNQPTDDFNYNNLSGEWGWHWMDNPLFPDRNTTLLRNAAGVVTGNIDWGTIDSTGWPVDTQDGISTIQLGETLQHYSAPDWVYSATESKKMLMMLPGMTDALAENILSALNPDLSTIPDPPSESGGTPSADDHRLDAPNLTPALVALNVTTAGGGQITGFEWRYDWYDDDDLPLAPPRPFNDVAELLNVEGMTTAKYDMMKDLVTIYSYDTNVVQNYISDVSSTVDPINPPNMPIGAARRDIPWDVDTDALPDLRYDLTKQLDDTSLTGLQQEADIFYKFIYNHLPEGNFKKFTLPVIDREHRGPSDHLGPAPYGSGNDGYPYNVGETGHEYDIDLGGGATEPGAEYPSLDPPFSRDSALSILVYRYGLTQEDAYRYSQDSGNARTPHAGIPVGSSRSFIPFIDPLILVPGLFELYFQPAYLPLQSAGTNVNAIVPPHVFDSVADVLEVPLYKFSRFSAGIMADPPSDYVCADIGKDEVTVNYYVSVSDIIQQGEYDDNGSPADQTDDQVAYTYDVYFDYNNDNNPEDMVTLTFGDDLRLVSSPPTANRAGVISTFSQPTGQRYLHFSHTFDINDIPAPDDTLAGTANGDFAYDYFGNPFITARVMAVKAAGTPEETNADAVVKVYLQNSCDTYIPLKVSILAIRVSADQFMLISSAGGGMEDPNSFRLYNWAYNGSPQAIDGTYPVQAGGRDPRTVFITPQADTISLTVYDLYNPAAAPCWPGLPVPLGTTVLPPGIINADSVMPAFPAAPYPDSGRDTDTAQVEIIGTTPNVLAEVAVDPPAIEQGASTLLHIGAYGGVSPYNLNIQIFDSGGNLVQSFNYGNYENNTLTVETDTFPSTGSYRVVLTALDSTTPIPTSSVDIANLIVGAQGSHGKSFTNVPNMTASINVEEADSPQKGFRASASISGGRGEYGYYWQVFDEFGAPARGDQNQLLNSNDQAPTFLFAPNQSQDGVYFVKVMVIDQTNINPNNSSNTVLATDTEMVVIGSPGASSYEPMATLAAIPPGNGSDSIDINGLVPVIYGGGPEPTLSTDSGVPPVVPSVAGAGEAIQIYGYNFDPNPLNNTVTFAGGATATPIAAPIPDPSYAGPAPVREIITVIVPADARTGWLTVTRGTPATSGGVSNHVFFQTHFMVSFDAIASIIPDITHNYTIEVDFQGDGIIDVRADTTHLSGNPGAVRHDSLLALQHDYALDGFGNYTATMIVTDQGTNKTAVSHQLIQIRDLQPLMNGTNNSANAFGLTTSLQPMYSDRYPLPGMGLDIRSYLGGMSSASGLKYKWNVDGNGRYALLTRTPPATPTFWETENNNTSATADIMPVDYDPFTDGATWTGRTSSATDNDWFRLDFPQAGCMSMLLECFTVNGTEQLRIELYDNGMALIDSDQILNGDTTALATTQRNAPAGSYYVHISGNSAQTYELEATYSPNPGNTFWESEPNDDETQADVMPIDYDPDRDAFPFTGEVRNNTDPEDWYVITTTGTGTLNAMVQCIDPGPADEVYVTLYNGVLIPISNATLDNANPAAVVGTSVDVPAGTFYIYISTNNNPRERYQIDPSFVPQGSWAGAGPVNFSVSSSINADGRFVSPFVPVNYYANLDFNFTTTDPNVYNIQIDNRDTNGDGLPDAPVTLLWDFNGDAIVDTVQAVTVSQISTELYSSNVISSTGYTFDTVDSYNQGTLRISGNLLITYYDNTTSVQPFTLPSPAPLPTVDVSNVLSTLSLPTLGNDTAHLVALTIYGDDYDSASGVTNYIQASDTVYIPSGLNPLADVMGYLATENPYVLSNTPGNTIFTVTGINGQGSDMQYWADLNTDGLFEIGGQGYFNPQTHTRVTAGNGLNMLNAGAINSYPTMLPGVYFQFVDIGIDIESDKGIYTAAALVRDNPPAGTATSYAFDSQAIMVGGNRGSGSASVLPLAADIFVDPLAGVTTQGISLESFVSGGATPYTYQWDIIHQDTGTPITFADANQHFVPNPVFVPSVDAADELAGLVSGTYEIHLTVFDSFGVVATTRTRYLTIEQAPLNAQLMAVPPSVAVDENVRFFAYVDGGIPPYTITINYNDPDNPGLTETVTTSGRYSFFQHAFPSVHLDGSTPANGRFDDPEDGVNVEITVTDSAGDIINPTNSPFNAVQKVLVGERLPLNVTMLASPSSGWNNFRVAVNYAVGGGRKLGGSSLGNLITSGPASNLSGLFGANSDYFVVISLVSSEGDLVDVQYRDTRTTIVNPLGSDGIMMNGDVGEVYDPVYMRVPYAGNYYAVVFVTDGAGEFAIAQQQIYAAGYLTPQFYGSTVPKVLRDRDGRPLHAARVWVDPLYSCPGNTSTPEENDYRLREADLQIFGDMLTVDPNPSFISPGFMAADDPANVPMFDLSYLENSQTNFPVDFYDTYTFGRVNINTASEEVLAAVFSKIIKQRAYYTSNGANYSRGDRDYENDLYVSVDEAHALARAVVEYRNAYYDAYKSSIGGSGTTGGYQYTHGANLDPYASGDVRVDHLPVVGPWDGVNPREEDYPNPVQRAAVWPDQNDTATRNTWDNFRGIYYNLDRGESTLQFYATSDIAVVRDQLPIETNENYAKYLNDTLDNGLTLDNDDPMGLDVRRGFDAREYFTYDAAAGQTRADARNNIAIIYSNGETAFTYMPNPPFQSMFDLYKVLGVLNDRMDGFVAVTPRSFEVTDISGDGNMDDVEVDSNGFSTEMRTTSGPSLFRYAEWWDSYNNEFKVAANYLDDIAPYITTRSYTFRATGVGGVSISGGSMTAPVNSDQIVRDRTVEQVIDVGKLHTQRRDPSAVNSSTSNRKAYEVVYTDRNM